MTSISKKPALSEKGYGYLIALFGILAASPLVVLATNICLAFYYLSCDKADWYFYNPAPAPLCVMVSLVPNVWVGSAIVAACVVVAILLSERRFYWYREVPSGIVVDEGWYSSLGFYSSGYQVYTLYIKGKNRVGETRTQGHSVTPKAYFEYKNGDKITFS